MQQPRLGFEVLDGMVPTARFVVPASVTERPFCVGREGEVILPFAGVLPVHAAFHFHRGRLFAASARADAPAIVGGAPLPTDDWREIPIPSVVRFGRIAVRTFLEAPRAPRTRIPTAIPEADRTTTSLRRRAAREGSSARGALAAFADRVASDWANAPLVVKLVMAMMPAAAILICAGWR